MKLYAEDVKMYKCIKVVCKCIKAVDDNTLYQLALDNILT